MCREKINHQKAEALCKLLYINYLKDKKTEVERKIKDDVLQIFNQLVSFIYRSRK